MRFNPRSTIREFYHDLSLRLYRFFSIVMKVDGDVTSAEIAGFKKFWDAYRILKLAKETNAEGESIPARSHAEGSRGFRDRVTTQLAVPESADLPVPAPQQLAGDPPFAAVNISAPDTPREDPVAELNALVGLSRVKQEVLSLTNFLKVQGERKKRGMREIPLSLHMVFTGSPGTGKTTVARLYGRILHKLGFLSKGHLVETDRAGLVAGYMGQTAERVHSIVSQAIGGVLFVDEAYALASYDGSDYGREAIDSLLNRMENHREDFALIVAGYQEDMQRFLSTNPGLSSRFSRQIHFDDYSPTELLRISDSFLEKHGLKIHDSAREKVLDYFRKCHAGRARDFGNGRLVRNTFEKIAQRQCDRLAPLATVSDADLSTLVDEDVRDL
jgi:SpoVK/Ycf46/Vps4 family AAA+-type ATPase